MTVWVAPEAEIHKVEWERKHGLALVAIRQTQRQMMLGCSSMWIKWWNAGIKKASLLQSEKRSKVAFRLSIEHFLVKRIRHILLTGSKSVSWSKERGATWELFSFYAQQKTNRWEKYLTLWGQELVAQTNYHWHVCVWPDVFPPGFVSQTVVSSRKQKSLFLPQYMELAPQVGTGCAQEERLIQIHNRVLLWKYKIIQHLHWQ